MSINIPPQDKLPKYAKPPVIETVLSVQFVPLPQFSNAAVGWFWKNFLGEEWASIKEVSRLEDQIEQFDSDKRWASSERKLLVRTQPDSERQQIIKDDGTRMIQVQDSRFIYNWKKGEDTYPSYEIILPEFFENYEKFKAFAAASGNPEIELNQWEVTYVNHIRKGELWDTPADWPAIFPWLQFPAEGVMDQRSDTLSGNWTSVIGENYGRLHTSIKYVRIGSVTGPEALALQFTARGPIDPEKGIDIETGFSIGHAAIVLSFDSIISDSAQKLWQRENK